MQWTKTIKPRGKIQGSFRAAVDASLTVHSGDGRLIVIAFDGYLLSGLVIKVNFFLTFLFHELVPGLTLLDIVRSYHRLLIGNRRLRILGGSGRCRRFDRLCGWSLDNSPGVINIDHMVAAIASYGDRIDPVRILDDSNNPGRAWNVGFANHGCLNGLG
jgi:hypothetical protein